MRVANHSQANGPSTCQSTKLDWQGGAVGRVLSYEWAAAQWSGGHVIGSRWPVPGEPRVGAIRVARLRRPSLAWQQVLLTARSVNLFVRPLMHIPSRRAFSSSRQVLRPACYVSPHALAPWCFLLTTRGPSTQANEQIDTMHLNFGPPDIFIRRPADFDFAAVDASEKRLNFNDLRGRVIVLNVWETRCVPCLAELHTFAKLAAHYSADKDVAVVCLSMEPAKGL